LFEQAEAIPKHLIPRDIVMPVNPRYTAQEWLDIMASQKASPEEYPAFKKGTVPQPGNDFSPTCFELIKIIIAHMNEQTF
jgi:hypothetical protein